MITGPTREEGRDGWCQARWAGNQREVEDTFHTASLDACRDPLAHPIHPIHQPPTPTPTPTPFAHSLIHSFTHSLNSLSQSLVLRWRAMTGGCDRLHLTPAHAQIHYATQPITTQPLITDNHSPSFTKNIPYHTYHTTTHTHTQQQPTHLDAQSRQSQSHAHAQKKKRRSPSG